MPAWVHSRAEHILAKNPSMPKSEAFAIAGQQGHALNKVPKDWGTAQGKATAKKKYDTPGDDKKTANPGQLESPKMQKKAWHDQLPGGLSDKKTPKDFSAGSLRSGRAVESEHTKDRHLQTEIAMDHLTEDPQYYKKLRKMEKEGFATSAYSGPLNPVIASGASFQPPRRTPQLQSAIQKTAAWTAFLDEMMKVVAMGLPELQERASQEKAASAASRVKDWGLNVWRTHNPPDKKEETLRDKLRPAEGIGGGILALNAAHAPDAVQQVVGAQRFHHGTRASNARSILETGLDPVRGGLVASGGAISTHTPEARAEALKDPFFRLMNTPKQLEKMHADFAARAKGHAFVTTRRGDAADYAALKPDGRVVSGTLPFEDFAARFVPDIDHDPTTAFKTNQRVSPQTFRASVGDIAKQRLRNPRQFLGYVQQNPKRFATGVGRLAAPVLGAGLLYHALKSDGAEKAAAGAPTRGNFMMASDIPAFKPPRLDRAIQKEGDMLPDYVTYGPGDFKPVNINKKTASTLIEHALTGTVGGAAGAALGSRWKKHPTLGAAIGGGLGSAVGVLAPPFAEEFITRGKYAMSTEELGAAVEILRKEAEVSPAVPWNGGTGNSHRMASDIPPFRAPRLDRAIQKEGSPSSQLRQTQSVGAPRATPPPGPSIAQISKPKGTGFGTGIAGAFKGHIGGTAPIALK